MSLRRSVDWFHRFLGASSPTAGGRTVDLATALVLLATYGCHLGYMVGTHSELFVIAASVYWLPVAAP